MIINFPITSIPCLFVKAAGSPVHIRNILQWEIYIYFISDQMYL